MNQRTDQTVGAGARVGPEHTDARSPRDEIRASFLDCQYQEMRALAAQSDVVEILLHGARPPDCYVLRFHCRGLVKTATGVVEANQFDFGLRFPEDYLRRADVAEVITVLGPPGIFHPNMRFPFICIGRLRPGTGIRDLVYQIYEMVTYNRLVMREDDALNAEACAWARRNQSRLPLERRPLRRRPLALQITEGADHVGKG